MGKKKGKEKKVSGLERTAQKTDRNAERKLKKELQKKGEDDIEQLIAEFQEQDRKRQEIVEEKCPPPSPRCNMSLTAHPDRDELIMFGGEYFNGKLTYLYNDLYFYNIKNNEWTLVKSPGAPPPRCAHQAVVVPQDGGQLWIFGGEFASQTQSQFYHYKDLWVLSLRDKRWQKQEAPGGPSSRSGHRMVACKKMLIVFGGFHDNIRDYKYYNDVHAFSLESYTWTKLEIAGVPPAPRSACVMGLSQDNNHIIIYGGYSKERVKKDVDIGKTHTDMFKLSIDSKCKQDSVPIKWRWQPVKHRGTRPSPRCGCSLIATPGNRAIVFGGVFDEEEDEEEVTGVFYNDMYSLELDNGKWHEVLIRGRRELKEKKKRRKKKDEMVEGDGDGPEDENIDGDSSDTDDENPEVMEEDIANLQVEESKMETSVQTTENKTETESDGIFTVTVGPQTSSTNQGIVDHASAVGDTSLFTPGPRMNCLLAVKRGVMFLYGGVYEVGDKQYTLSDMYSLDLHKLEQWTTIIACDLDLQEWQESDEGSDSESDGSDESDDSEEEMEGATAEGIDDDADDDDDDDAECMEEDVPPVLAGEILDEYFSRCLEFWLQRAEDVAREEGLAVSDKQKKKAASRMAKEYYQLQSS